MANTLRCMITLGARLFYSFLPHWAPMSKAKPYGILPQWTRCHGLNLKCLLRSHMLKAWLPAYRLWSWLDCEGSHFIRGLIHWQGLNLMTWWEGVEIGRQDIETGSQSLTACPWRTYSLSPCLLGCHPVNCCHGSLLWCCALVQARRGGTMQLEFWNSNAVGHNQPSPLTTYSICHFTTVTKK